MGRARARSWLSGRRQGHTACVVELLAAGAERLLHDAAGRTPGELAAANGQARTAAVLAMYDRKPPGGMVEQA